MAKRVIVFRGFWSVDDIQINSKKLFIFGDNDMQEGIGGQAIIREETNTAGIPTKKAPDNHPDSFYSDDDKKDNIKNINKAIARIKKRLRDEDYNAVVFPENGLGTGLAKLAKKAPVTNQYLLWKLKRLAEYIEKGSSENLPFLSELRPEMEKVFERKLNKKND